MRIRAATMHDLPEVVECEGLAFPRFGPRSRVGDSKPGNNLEPQIRQGSVYVIGLPERIVGYISLARNPDHVFVGAIGILPELQGRGLGSQLLAFAEKMTLRLRLPSLKLFTDSSIANNRFYRRRGFLEFDRCEEGRFSRVFYMKRVAPH